ncbi:hypothetical protein CXR34_08720 [Microbacterium hominis]|uniref:Uncharacterized protein n=1 Tax=Microbacterium hominis TaxID=162426 RepID=A0A2K9DBP2_9MICO|nr:hypothetical protein CXR34_08720 [Microbacterium hominis]
MICAVRTTHSEVRDAVEQRARPSAVICWPGAIEPIFVFSPSRGDQTSVPMRVRDWNSTEVPDEHTGVVNVKVALSETRDFVTANPVGFAGIPVPVVASRRDI